MEALMSRIISLGLLTALLLGRSLPAMGQDSATIQKKLVEDYPLTTPTAAFDDIVTPGAVVMLQKGPLMMVAVSSTVNPYVSTYKNGKIQSGMAKAKSWRDKLGGVPVVSALPGVAQTGGGPATRTFVVGEKMWVTKIDTRPDAVVFDLFTDAISDVRYKTSVTFPFPKGSTPSAEDVEKLVGEVFKVQPSDDAKPDAQQQPAPASGQQQPAAGQQQSAAGNAGPAQAPAAPQQSAEAPPPPIAPPPPPPADPKTISVGQTPDEVTAALGQPEKKVKLSGKEIYYYKDMKVVFVKGKVTDVQ
jgi:hypothetical protein